MKIHIYAGTIGSREQKQFWWEEFLYGPSRKSSEYSQIWSFACPSAVVIPAHWMQRNRLNPVSISFQCTVENFVELVLVLADLRFTSSKVSKGDYQSARIILVNWDAYVHQLPVHQINKRNILFQLMSVPCADTSTVLKEQVQYFLVLCRLENGICDRFAALGIPTQPWGDSDDALGQHPLSVVPQLPISSEAVVCLPNVKLNWEFFYSVLFLELECSINICWAELPSEP